MSKNTMMIVALCALSTAAFAGCVGPDAETTSMVELESQEEAAAGQMVRFAATAQNNSTEAQFHFDFGDGSTQEVSGAGGAEAEHAFERGGTYTVTVSMRQGNQTLGSDHAAIRIVEQHALDTKVVASGPLPNQTATQEWTIATGANATSILANMSLENTMILGQSVVELQVLDAEGNVLAAQNVTLDEAAAETVLIEAELDDQESVVLRAVAHSGSASIDGDATVGY